jgi:hypothetical protein
MIRSGVFITTAAAVAFFLTACPGVMRVPDAGAATRQVPPECSEACATLRQLHCPGERGSPGKDERYGTADDVSCERVCADLELAAKEAPGFSLHPACISAASSCAQVNQCAR